MRSRRPSRQREPVISLINIVFLILIFFMVAGSLSGRNTTGIAFVETSDLECCVDPSAIAVSADGQLLSDASQPISLSDHLAGLDGEAPTIRLLPDQQLPAAKLLAIVQEFKREGAGRVIIVTEDVDA
ncbi:MAG: biopolymer transporter ExbD [Pseudomonadota bacterium]